MANCKVITLNLLPICKKFNRKLFEIKLLIGIGYKCGENSEDCCIRIWISNSFNIIFSTKSKWIIHPGKNDVGYSNPRYIALDL